MRLYQILCAVCLVCLNSCEKDELPVLAHEPGLGIVTQLNMMQDYRYQLFYDLGSNSVTSQNIKTDWDLGFEAGDKGWHVVLNSARGGAASRTGNSNFASVTSYTGAVWQWDEPSGNLDSTAIGDHRGTSEVYLIDRGYNHLGQHTGYRKVIIQDVTDNFYTVRFAQLDGKGDTIVHIGKDTSISFVALSFDHSCAVLIEPSKTEWDLLFTQYTHLFDTFPNTYLVSGVLINRFKVQVAIDDQKDFSEISYADVASYAFSTLVNTIGYDWKEFDFSSGIYNVFPHINYIIKDTDGHYFKLHFIDFYNASGAKGSPKFEMQEL